MEILAIPPGIAAVSALPGTKSLATYYVAYLWDTTLATRATLSKIRGARRQLLHNRATLTRPADRIQLREKLRANRALFITCVLTDDLNQHWWYAFIVATLRFWHQWFRRAPASKLRRIVTYAAQQNERIDSLPSHSRYP